MRLHMRFGPKLIHNFGIIVCQNDEEHIEKPKKSIIFQKKLMSERNDSHQSKQLNGEIDEICQY